MKSLKQIVALAAALLLGLAMVGCGGAQEKADPAPVEEAAPAAPADEAAPAEGKTLEKFEGNKMERAEEDE